MSAESIALYAFQEMWQLTRTSLSYTRIVQRKLDRLESYARVLGRMREANSLLFGLWSPTLAIAAACYVLGMGVVVNTLNQPVVLESHRVVYACFSPWCHQLRVETVGRHLSDWSRAVARVLPTTQ